MLVHVISTLLPVFSVLMLGYLLVRARFITSGFVEDLNHLIYWVALPAFIVGSLGRAEKMPDSVVPLAAAFGLSTLLFVAACWGGLKISGFSTASRGTFLQAAYRGNLAFIAIPILIYALRGLPKNLIETAVSQAVFLFAPALILYNVISAFVFPSPKGGVGTRLPLLIASCAGVGLILLPWKLPGALLDSFDYFGRLAAPAAVLCVGGTMAGNGISDHWRPALAASFLKVVVSPCLALLIAIPFGLGRTETLILLIFTTAPCATAGYVIARKMGGDGPLAASSIFISTILSVVTLSVIIAWFG